MAYDESTYMTAMSLLEEGASDSGVAASMGVSRGTVRRWRLACAPPQAILRSRSAATWSVPDDTAYCYLLGAYLGDGTVSLRTPGSARLQVVNDRYYPAISQEILAAMRTTFPAGSLGVHPSSAGESDVLCITDPAIPRAFPQHGPGRKHLRAILLDDWQLE